MQGIMKKLISFVILLSATCCSTVVHSRSVEQADPGFVLLDVLFYRPVGLAATVIGTGVFIGLSPLTALASIPKPHDAFAKTANILILAPGAYTFIRPLGDREFPYHAPPYKYKPQGTHQNNVMPKQRPVTSTVPDVQPPRSTPGTVQGL
jgi:hypothetical protein